MHFDAVNLRKNLAALNCIEMYFQFFYFSHFWNKWFCLSTFINCGLCGIPISIVEWYQTFKRCTKLMYMYIFFFQQEVYDILQAQMCVLFWHLELWDWDESNYMQTKSWTLSSDNLDWRKYCEYAVLNFTSVYTCQLNGFFYFLMTSGYGGGRNSVWWLTQIQTIHSVSDLIRLNPLWMFVWKSILFSYPILWVS
jgi:hypothetical protein